MPVAVEKLFAGRFDNKVRLAKLLNVRWPKTPKFAEVTPLVPFSTATPVFNNYERPRGRRATGGKDCT